MAHKPNKIILFTVTLIRKGICNLKHAEEPRPINGT